MLLSIRVEFVPNDEDRTFVKRSMMYQHRDQIGNGGYLFDGAMMFTPHRLAPPGGTFTLVSTRQEVRPEIKTVL